MMAVWGMLLYILFPVPLLLLVILSLPLPEFCKGSVRGMMLKITDIIFWKFLPGGFSIFSFAMLLSTGLLVFSSAEVIQHHNKPVNQVNPQEQRCMRLVQPLILQIALT